MSDTAKNGSVVTMDDVSIARDGHTIWEHSSLSIPQGAITALIGPNGSGKTTMLQMILGLLPATSGTLRVLGETPKRGNSRIGYVPQDYTTIVGGAIRAWEMVALGLTGDRWGVKPLSDDDRSRVNEVIAEVGAQDFAHQRMSSLSGGQRQRIAVAQALVSHPELLVLDEPLANLDLKNQREIVDLLAHLNKTRSVSIIIVTHDLNPVLHVLTGIVYLLDEHAHYDSVDGAVDSSLLSHLYGTKVQVVRTAQGDLFTRSV